jgi:hypothetical protein
MPMTCGIRCLKDVAGRSVCFIGRSTLAVVGVLSALILGLCLGCRPKPPDLTTCTRIKIQYENGALQYFFPSIATQERILNEEEREYVRSYDTWTVTDQEQVNVFAHRIGQGTYAGRIFGTTEIRARIVAYKPSGRKISFSVTGGSDIITGGRRSFSYAARGLSLASLDPPGLKPLLARWNCGINLHRLIYEDFWPNVRDPRPHLDPNHWCDRIVRAHYGSRGVPGDLNSNRQERQFPDTWVTRTFTCPSFHAAVDGNDAQSQPGESDSSSKAPGTRRSDYAMNSNCRADSPKDMVFLFESKPGWNQQGGPELFTFDNHDPKGGLVLLNDGTVKFIRTEEELKQLRWK